MKRLLPLLFALIAFPHARAQGTVTLTCQGNIVGQNVAANLVVPAGAKCFLNDTLITGNVQVQRNAILTVQNANIQGRIETAAGFRRLIVQGSIIGGELRAEGGESFSMNDSQVIGHVRINRNSGPISIDHVTLNRNLECRNNKVMPTGTGLRVDGRQLGQCSRL